MKVGRILCLWCNSRSVRALWGLAVSWDQGPWRLSQDVRAGPKTPARNRTDQGALEQQGPMHLGSGTSLETGMGQGQDRTLVC